MADLQDAGDAILAERSADGDTDAFAVLVRRHGPFLRAFAIRLLGGARADADDCVQEALIAAWHALPELQDPSRFRSWLVAIVSRKATDRLRRRRPEEPGIDDELPSAHPEPEDAAVTSSPLEQLDVPVATVRGRLARARQSLLDAMKEWR